MELKKFLDRKVDEYNQPSFILSDPISIPHQFSRKQDIEIAGFFAAIFSWGNRTTIIRKSRELMQSMDNAPYQFIMQHADEDLWQLGEFRHRTFNSTDLLYFISFFRYHYSHFDSLEDAFLMQDKEVGKPAAAVPGQGKGAGEKSGAGYGDGARASLSGFHRYFFSMEDIPPRTYKHIATPDRNSSCKRLNMFLRWMVRQDKTGVDFGIWQRISPSTLICPLDVHVARVARRLGLLIRTQSDWRAAEELTAYLRTLDQADPVKYDFALFGLGVMEKF
jgi:uncharacterized protein (TIGR02757 family)